MMREPTLLILAAVAPGPLHGYGILQTVQQLSNGRITLRPGTLYAALDRLVTEGSLVQDGDDVVNGRTRRYYRMTDAGADTLRRELAIIDANSSAARSRLELRPGPATA